MTAASKSTLGFRVRSVDNAKISRGGKAETAFINKYVAYLNSYFPPEEQRPISAFINSARKSNDGKLGLDEKNRLLLASVSYNGEMAGAISSIFASISKNESMLLVGYMLVSPQYDGGTAGSLLLRASINFARGQAQASGKSLIYLVSEVETSESASSTDELARRVAKFKKHGLTVADCSTGFTYGSPNGESLLPLSLIIKPQGGAPWVSAERLAEIVKSAYAIIYSGEKNVEKHLAGILSSIPAEGVRLVELALP